MNEEVKFILTANSGSLEKSIDKIIKDIDLASLEMEHFSVLVDNATDKQLEDIASNLTKGIEEAEAELEKLKQELLNVMATTGDFKALDDLNAKIKQTEEYIAGAEKKLDMFVENDGLEEVGSKFDRLKAKAESLGQKMTRLGKIISTAFVFASFGTLRKGFQEAISMSDTARAKFDSITSSIASGLIPIIDWLVNKIQYAFVWVAKLIYVLTGFNIISSAIDQTSKKIDKVTSSTKKSNKALNKMLGGLDEITNIETQTNTGGGLNQDLVGLQNTMGELEKMQDMFDNINVDWVKDLLKELLVIAGVLATMWSIVQIAKFIDAVGAVTKAFKTLGGSTGVGVAIAGFAILAGSAVNIARNWDKMSTAQKVLSVGLAVVGGAMLAVGVSALVMGTSIATAISVATLGIGAIIGAIVSLVAIMGNWFTSSSAMHDQILSEADAQEALNQATENYENALSNNINAIDNYESKLSALQDAEARTGLSGKSLADQVASGALTYQNMNAEQREVYKAYVATEKAQKELDESTQELTKASQEQEKANFELQLSQAKSTEDMYTYRDSVVKAMEDGSISSEQGKELLEKAMADMSTASRETFMEDIPKDIKDGLEPSKFATAGNKIKNFFGDLWGGITKGASKMWTKITDKFKDIGKIVATAITDTVKKAVNSVLRTAVKIINGFIGAINLAISAINIIPGVNIKKLKKMELPSFDVGTPNVPYDMLAQVHKGEAIIPEKFNDEKYFGGNEVDMSETNGLLQEILEVLMSNGGNKLSNSEIGRIALEYIKSYSRLRGEVVV